MPHAGAGVPASRPAAYGPSAKSRQGGSATYGSYVDEVVAFQTTVNGVTKRYFPHYNHLYSVAALAGEPVNGIVPVKRMHGLYRCMYFVESDGLKYYMDILANIYQLSTWE